MLFSDIARVHCGLKNANVNFYLKRGLEFNVDNHIVSQNKIFYG